MSQTVETKDDRINLRLKHNAKQMLERAASLKGQTVSKFVLNSALACATDTIQQHEIMTLTSRESEAFFNALASPVQFNEKLHDALKEHDLRVIDQ